MAGGVRISRMRRVSTRRDTPWNALAMASSSGCMSCGDQPSRSSALATSTSAYALLSRDNPQQLEFVGPAVADRGLGGSVHIVLPKQQDELRRSVNRAIAASRADGTFQRIVRQYFPLGLD